MEQKLSQNDLFTLIALLCHGGYFWVLPSFATKENGSMGILSMLLGAGTGLLILILAYRLSQKANGQPGSLPSSLLNIRYCVFQNESSCNLLSF